MSNEPKQRRRATGPRRQRPIYVLVSYTDEAGQPVQLEASRLRLVATRDAEQVAKEVLRAAAAGEPIPSMTEVQLPTAAN